MSGRYLHTIWDLEHRHALIMHMLEHLAAEDRPPNKRESKALRTNSRVIHGYIKEICDGSTD